jgi:hypothetical protein
MFKFVIDAGGCLESLILSLLEFQCAMVLLPALGAIVKLSLGDGSDEALVILISSYRPFFVITSSCWLF